MKKICYITTIAATLEFFKSQMDYLHEKGYEVYAISSYSEDYKENIGKNTKFIPVEIARGIYPLTLRKSVLELKKIFEDNKFDIVQYSTPNAAFVASIATKLAGVKVRNYHLMGFRYLGAKGVLRYILKLLEKITCRNSTHIECVSKSNLELGIKEKVFAKAKAEMVWNGSSGGVDLKRFDIENKQKWRAEVRQALEYSENDFVFGFMGRITKDKGINELIEAFLPMSDRAKLLITGPAEGLDTLDAKILKKAKQNDNIMFHDSVSDVERYFAAIDVLVLPSYREGFGNVIIEAAAVGTPAIISNIPGPVDAVIPGETAKLVKAKDVDTLKKAMEEFLDNKDLAREMSDSAYSFVASHFDSEKLNEKIIERKEELLGDVTKAERTVGYVKS
ncbi:MAG: glycosyltransferase family 4 protein [Clostridia bacterium]|nr:glycosyltransferase family 4 protein [Clostridia bacterium]